MNPTVLFQLTFTFIYSTFAKKFQFQQNKRISNKLKCAFDMDYFCQLILLLSLFLQLFMSLTTLFGIIYRFSYIILTIFYIYV